MKKTKSKTHLWKLLLGVVALIALVLIAKLVISTASASERHHGCREWEKCQPTPTVEPTVSPEPTIDPCQLVETKSIVIVDNVPCVTPTEEPTVTPTEAPHEHVSDGLTDEFSCTKRDCSTKEGKVVNQSGVPLMPPSRSSK
jgi:hypothetical protein